MIKITAEFKEKDGEKGVEMNVEVEGKAEDVINETMTIVNELPKELEKVDHDLYREYLRKQLLDGLDHLFYEVLGSDPDEDEEDEDDDESDEV